MASALVCAPRASAADTTGASRGPARTALLFNKPSGTLTLSPAPRPAPRAPILGNAYVTSGFIKKELPSVATGQPYVTEGTLKIETDARGQALVPAGTPAQPKPQADLAKRIQDVCGRSARDVEVISESATSYRVRFTVRNFNDAEKVSRQVLKLPELLPYQVEFEVQVQQ